MTYLITYSNEITDTISIFGFKLFTKNEAKEYMKNVYLLMDNDICFDNGYDEIQYDKDNFEIKIIKPDELKVLKKLFNIDLSKSSSNLSYGIFPDANNDAYENELCNNDDNEHDEDQLDDFDTDEF